MPRRKDIWRVGIVRAPVNDIISGGCRNADVHWLAEEPRFSFLADPFGWQCGETLSLFVERYDYRARHGVIDLLTLDSAYNVLETRCCLREPWHLSYPFVFEGEGTTWMLPEAHRSGGLTLYRVAGSLREWKAAARITLDCVPVDATPLWHDGRWWLFYSPADTRQTKFGHLHVAFADSLCGPWTPHSLNPVRVDRTSARPGGRAVVMDGRIMLPVQDCSATYGGAIRPLWITRLSESAFEATAGAPLEIPASAGVWSDGMHTLSACGAITLIDVKRIDTSARGMLLELTRAWRRRG
jgi:hypothetical protein